MVPRCLGVERWLLWRVDSAELSRPCLGLTFCIAVTLLPSNASNPCLQQKVQKLFGRGFPALLHFDLFPETTHLLAQRSFQRVQSLPATKAIETVLAGIPHASSFRFTSRKHPPSCLAVLATPSPTTIDVAVVRWLFCRCGVSFLQRNKPKLSGTYLQLLGLHRTKC